MPPVGASLRALWPRMSSTRSSRGRVRAGGLVAGDHFIVGPLLVALSPPRFRPFSLSGRGSDRRLGRRSSRSPRRFARASGREACGVDPGRARVTRRDDDHQPLRVSRRRLRRDRSRFPRLRRGSRRRRARKHSAGALRRRQPRRRTPRGCARDHVARATAASLRVAARARVRAAAPGSPRHVVLASSPVCRSPPS